MNILRTLLVAFLFALMSLPLQVNAATNDVMEYGKQATFTGLVFIEYFYEEPGYGDSPASDPIVGACLMKLDRKAKLKNDAPLNRVHLLFTSEDRNKCSELVGKRVEITGTLGEVHTGHHHGDALFDVKNFKVLR